MTHRLSILCLVALALIGCKEQQLTYSSDAKLSLSADSVLFDTIFTAAGSSTQQVMIYNRNSNAIRISRVWWQKNGGQGHCFFANLDGENNINNLRDIDLNGGDSLYLFLRAEIDPYNSDAHPIESDTLWLECNGNRTPLYVEAYGMDVERIRTDSGSTIYPNGLRLTAAKPYLIYDTLWIAGKLTIEPGATLYMHKNAHIIAYGNVDAQGTPDKRIRIMGDRTDKLFPKVPYRVASGQWGGIYLFRLDSMPNPLSTAYRLANIDILSGTVGLFCHSNTPENKPTLYLRNARIHNMAQYGVVMENTDARILNTEVSNCASYGLYMAGGKHIVEHTSVANYFGYPYTTINIHNVNRENVAGVYILATSYDMDESVSTLRNCIATGAVTPALVVDSIPESGFQGQITGCYLQCDTLPAEWASQNVYAQKNDTVFKNTYYLYNEYNYYDFHLYNNSPARHIGLPLSSLQLDGRNKDLDGLDRDPEHPDAGCYMSPQQ